MLTRRALCATFASLAVSMPARAQSYPAKTVRIIVPFAPGGSVDVVARLIADQLTKRMGQAFIIENIPGASGNIGTGRAAAAAPDGYTLLAAFSSFAINPALYPNLPYDISRDFKPIALAASATHVFVVHPSVKAKTIAELEALIRSGEVTNYAHGGVGTPGHLLGERYRLSAGLDLVPVPFNGAGPAVTSVLGGHTPMGVLALSPAAKHITDGRLRALAVTSRTRTDFLPDAPTMIESGRPDIVGDLWVGLLAPAKTPDDIVVRLNAEVRAALADPETAAKLKAVGFQPEGSSPEAFGALIRSDAEAWGKVIRDAKIEANP